MTFPGNGVYRSTDGGATWTHSGLARQRRIGRLAVDPTNANRSSPPPPATCSYPAAPAASTARTDGGNLAARPGRRQRHHRRRRCRDRSRNPNRVYAAMWDHVRQPRGASTAASAPASTAAPTAGPPGPGSAAACPPSSSNLGRMGIAIAPTARRGSTPSPSTPPATSPASGPPPTAATLDADHQHVVAVLVAVDLRLVVRPALGRPGRRRSMSWSPAYRCWNRSTRAPTGGATPRAFHADQHAMAWDPASAGRVYLGNDGGVYRSQSSGSLTGTWTKATYQPFNQFYTVAVSRQDASRVLRRRAGQRLAAIVEHAVVELDQRRRRHHEPDRPDQPEQGLHVLAVRRVQPLDRPAAAACQASARPPRTGATGSRRSCSTRATRRSCTTAATGSTGRPTRPRRWTVISPDLSRGVGGRTATRSAPSPRSRWPRPARPRSTPAPTTAACGSPGTPAAAGRRSPPGCQPVDHPGRRRPGQRRRWRTVRVRIPQRRPGRARVRVQPMADPAGGHLRRAARRTGQHVVLDPRNPAELYAAPTWVCSRPRHGGAPGRRWAPACRACPSRSGRGRGGGTATVLTAATFGLGIYRTTTS